MSSPLQLRRILVGVAGLIGFSILMAARESFSTLLGRALVAGLAALVGSSAFFYVLKTAPKRPSQE
jgi:uncharacterized membrane protein